MTKAASFVAGMVTGVAALVAAALLVDKFSGENGQNGEGAPSPEPEDGGKTGTDWTPPGMWDYWD